MRRETFALALLAFAALALTACAPQQIYPTIPDMAQGDLNCEQLAQEMQVAKDHKTAVQIRRASVKSEDVLMFIGDFGQVSSAAGPLAEQIAQDRVTEITTLQKRKGCI